MDELNFGHNTRTRMWDVSDLDDNDIPDLINGMDILVHSSIDPEPFGRVILEGMALKKPVIATAHGGPLEIIRSGESGVLVPPGDPAALAVKWFPGKWHSP